jgi:hypothetical protein
MVTPLELNKIFEQIVADHVQLKGFYTISRDKMDIEKMNIDKYPFLYAQTTGATIDETGTTFTYECIVADLVIENHQDINQVLSQTQGIVQDIMAEFIQSYSPSQFINPPQYHIELPVQCNPIQYEYNNSVTGWSFTLEIIVPNALNLCNALYTFNA